MPAIGKKLGIDAWLDQNFPTHLRVPRCAPCVPFRLERGIKNPLSESRRKTNCQAMNVGKGQIRLLELAARTRNPALEGLRPLPHGLRHAAHISTAIHQAIPHLRGNVLDALQVLIEALKNELPQGNCSQRGKEGSAAQ